MNNKGKPVPGSFREPVLVDKTSNVSIASKTPTIYTTSPATGSGELKVSDSPYDINSLSIDNLPGIGACNGGRNGGRKSFITPCTSLNK